LLLSVIRSERELQHLLPLVSKVLEQTQARVFDGERHHPDKIVSIFEEHTAVIRKGKASKPTEFGRLVRVDEVENGLVSHYDVADGNSADQPQWMPALDKHTEQFAQPPQMATANRGFFSADNERQAKKTRRPKSCLASSRPLEKAGQAATRALVSQSAQMARRHRVQDRHSQASLCYEPRHLQR